MGGAEVAEGLAPTGVAVAVAVGAVAPVPVVHSDGAGAGAGSVAAGPVAVGTNSSLGARVWVGSAMAVPAGARVAQNHASAATKTAPEAMAQIQGVPGGR